MSRGQLGFICERLPPCRCRSALCRCLWFWPCARYRIAVMRRGGCPSRRIYHAGCIMHACSLVSPPLSLLHMHTDTDANERAETRRVNQSMYMSRESVSESLLYLLSLSICPRSTLALYFLSLSLSYSFPLPPPTPSSLTHASFLPPFACMPLCMHARVSLSLTGDMSSVLARVATAAVYVCVCVCVRADDTTRVSE